MMPTPDERTVALITDDADAEWRRWRRHPLSAAKDRGGRRARSCGAPPGTPNPRDAAIHSMLVGHLARNMP
jgi:hypothetical protein